MYKLILFLLCSMLVKHSLGQNGKQLGRLSPKTAVLTRVKCSCSSEGGSYRFIYYGPTYLDSQCNYSIIPLFTTPDSTKIRLIGELLQAFNDSAVCCKKVHRYGGTGAAPFSITYTMQTDALYLINLIAFGVVTKSYSPYPVLYDTVDKQEIVQDQQKIIEVFKIYKKWFEVTKAAKFKSYTFPLINQRYKWFGGLQKPIHFGKLPTHPKQSTLGLALD